MRAVIQRVIEASVKVDGNIVGNIDKGLLVFLGVGREDDKKDLEYIHDKIINLRIFEDNDGKMNLSVLDIKGDIQVVSQFTLYGDVRKGRRPSFIESGDPKLGKEYYDKLIKLLKETNGLGKIQLGKFGEDMKVNILNDGPVTIMLDSKKTF